MKMRHGMVGAVRKRERGGEAARERQKDKKRTVNVVSA